MHRAHTQGGEIAVVERMVLEGDLPADQFLVEFHDWFATEGSSRSSDDQRLAELICGIEKLGFALAKSNPPNEYSFVRIAKPGAPAKPAVDPRIVRTNGNQWGSTKTPEGVKA